MFRKLYAIFALTAATAAAIPCTEEQLQGTYNSFSLPGGGGEYFPETRQVVSWNWATGSPVSSIQSVNIRNRTHTYNVSWVRGLPVNISPTNEDQGGFFRITLPSHISPGYYVYDVELISQGESCSIYSNRFEILSKDDDNDDGDDNGNNDDNNGNVIHRCNMGDTRCARASSGFRSCTETPRGRRYRNFQVCPSGQTCEQSGTNAVCSLGSGNGNGDDNDNGNGNEECETYAEYSCSGDAYRVCIRNEKGNLVYSEPVSCGEGRTCQKIGTSVSCPLKSGSDECYLGAKRCVGVATFSECIQGDDGFTMWTESQPCSRGNFCSNNGMCAPLSFPRGCDIGHQRCVTKKVFLTCIDGIYAYPQQCPNESNCYGLQDNHITCM